jgi:hypothetical protein
MKPKRSIANRLAPLVQRIVRRTRVQQVAARAAKTNHSKALGKVAKMILRLLMPLATRMFLSGEKGLCAEQRYRIEWNEVVS